MAQREMRINPERSTMDQLIAEHAQIARAVYENRTAGDMTFTGLLAEFVTDLRDNGLLKEE